MKLPFFIFLMSKSNLYDLFITFSILYSLYLGIGIQEILKKLLLLKESNKDLVKKHLLKII